MAKQFTAEDAQKIIERFKLSLSLKDPAKLERFNKATKAGYSMEFAAIYAQQGAE